MEIIKKRYKLLSDFERVRDFLVKIYDVDNMNSYFLPQFFEYAQTHPAFNHSVAHRIVLWEDNGEIVALISYEMDLGECYLNIKQGYYYLLNEMLSCAEEEISITSEGVKKLIVWVTNKEEEKKKLLLEENYEKVYEEEIKIYNYPDKWENPELPEGYEIISLEEENEMQKIHECLWYGFDHEEEVDNDIDCRLLMQSGPNFSKDLTTVIKDSKGNYVCYAGMWYDEVNKYAYLEPLATLPKYRGLGLGKVALNTAMKKTKKLGARYCFGGSLEFYDKLGFETIGTREAWRKVLK